MENLLRVLRYYDASTGDSDTMEAALEELSLLLFPKAFSAADTYALAVASGAQPDDPVVEKAWRVQEAQDRLTRTVKIITSERIEHAKK